MSDHNYLVHRPALETVRGPANLMNADVVEVRVILRPMKYWTNPDDTSHIELRPSGEMVTAAGCIDRWVRVESKDHRVIFHVLQELLRLVARVYLGVNL